MLERLLTATDWDFAGIKLKDAQPMLVERKICNVQDKGKYIIVHVDNGPHPWKVDEKTGHSILGTAADHYIRREDITGITYYTEPVITLLQSLGKSGKLIAVGEA